MTKKQELIKKCYVCLKKLGYSKLILNPQVNAKWWKDPERYIYLPTQENNLCHKVLKELACWGKCDSQCCAAYHMTKFDLDKLIADIKNGLFIHNYTDRAIELLKQVKRI